AASVAATAKSRVPPPNTDATTSPPSTAVPTAAASVPAARSARAARTEPPSSAAMPPTSAFATRIASATFAASRIAPRTASRAVAASARPRRSGAGKALPESGHELSDGNADLCHRVALADRHLTIVERREVHGHAERRADLVLAPVAAADRLRLVVRRHPVRPDEIPHLARERREPLVLRERQDRDLVRRDLRAEAQDDADALLVWLLVVGRAE